MQAPDLITELHSLTAPLPHVGGKAGGFAVLNRLKLPFPPGFVISTEAFRDFTKEVRARTLDARGEASRTRTLDPSQMLDVPLPSSLCDALSRRLAGASGRFAVRSSCSHEDGSKNSFAGVFETFLNVPLDEVLRRIRDCYASCYSPRAVSYAENRGIPLEDLAMAVIVQECVSPICAGTAFSADPLSGTRDNMVVEAWWGLGNAVVDGSVTPAHFRYNRRTGAVYDSRPGKGTHYVSPGSGSGVVSRPLEAQHRGLCLGAEEVRRLANHAGSLEEALNQPVDIEWAKREDGTLVLLQCRPLVLPCASSFTEYELKVPPREAPILTGMPTSDKIVTGTVRKMKSRHDPYGPNDIVVIKDVGVDWVPSLVQAKAIIVETGAWTSHFAIIMREYNLPTLLGADSAMALLEDGEEVTLSCVGNPGKVWRGALPIVTKERDITALKKPKTPVHLVLSALSNVEKYLRLPVDGIGLVRLEFVITDIVKIHPLALVAYDQGTLTDAKTRARIEALTEGYALKAEYYVATLAAAISEFASRCPTGIVNVRAPDFTSDDYLTLIGGEFFEPPCEANPMMGWRGTTRLLDATYVDAFALDCAAFRRAIDDYGFSNVNILVPFCRTPDDGRRIYDTIRAKGPRKARIGMMVELPANALLARYFADIFDFFLVGPMDLTQLTYGADRSSTQLGRYNNETLAVKELVLCLLRNLEGRGKEIFIGGWPLFQYFEEYQAVASNNELKLVELPDRFVSLIENVAALEATVAAKVTRPLGSTTIAASPIARSAAL
jgi:pyruvate,water dikinase